MRRNGFYQRSSSKVNWQKLLLYLCFGSEAAARMIVWLAFDLSFRLKEVRHVAGRLSGYKVAENSVIQCLSLVGRLYFKSALS